MALMETKVARINILNEEEMMRAACVYRTTRIVSQKE